MNIRIWPIVVLGFGCLVTLIAISGWIALTGASRTYAGISALHDAEHRTEQAFSALRSNLQISAIVIRDYLLDPNASVSNTRDQLRQRQSATSAEFEELRALMAAGDAKKLEKMHSEIDAYWHSLDPIWSWTPEEKAKLSYPFLRNGVLPRLQAILRIADQIQELTSDSILQRRREIDRRHGELPMYVARILGITIIIGIVVAVLSVFRILQLENMSALQREKVESAEAHLRKLSQQLVRIQEEERRALSRELHDQVGQTLTALRIGLGNLDEQLGPAPGNARQQLQITKNLCSQAIRSVRELAMGLRPAMLDDLGLGAALHWQARQHSRVCGTPVSVDIDESLDSLSEPCRICIYRVIQEALNNAGKHSHAQHIEVSVKHDDHLVSITVCDDGVGFGPSPGSNGGLGLIGMNERLRQLGGSIAIDSRPGAGTAISAQIPLDGNARYEPNPDSIGG